MAWGTRVLHKLEAIVGYSSSIVEPCDLSSKSLLCPSCLCLSSSQARLHPMATLKQRLRRGPFAPGELTSPTNKDLSTGTKSGSTASSSRTSKRPRVQVEHEPTHSYV